MQYVQWDPVNDRPFTQEQRDAVQEYIDLFFKIKDRFRRAARAGQVSEASLVDWVREHAPEYESVSKKLGFDSLEDEYEFMKVAVKSFRKAPSISRYIGRMRRGYKLSEEEKTDFIHALGDNLDYEPYDWSQREIAVGLKAEFQNYNPKQKATDSKPLDDYDDDDDEDEDEDDFNFEED